MLIKRECKVPQPCLVLPPSPPLLPTKDDLRPHISRFMKEQKLVSLPLVSVMNVKKSSSMRSRVPFSMPPSDSAPFV